MLYSCTHMAAVGVKGLIVSEMSVVDIQALQSARIPKLQMTA